MSSRSNSSQYTVPRMPLFPINIFSRFLLCRYFLWELQTTVTSFRGDSSVPRWIGASHSDHHPIPLLRMMFEWEGHISESILIQQTGGISVARRLCYVNRPVQGFIRRNFSMMNFPPQWQWREFLLFTENPEKCWCSLTRTNLTRMLYALVACLVWRLRISVNKKFIHIRNR